MKACGAAGVVDTASVIDQTSRFFDDALFEAHPISGAIFPLACRINERVKLVFVLSRGSPSEVPYLLGARIWGYGSGHDIASGLTRKVHNGIMRTRTTQFQLRQRSLEQRLYFTLVCILAHAGQCHKSGRINAVLKRRHCSLGKIFSTEQSEHQFGSDGYETVFLHLNFNPSRVPVSRCSQ